MCPDGVLAGFGDGTSGAAYAQTAVPEIRQERGSIPISTQITLV